MRDSQFESELVRCGAREITLPSITRETLRAVAEAERIAGRALSFAELSQGQSGHLECVLAGELQWAMQTMFRQYNGGRGPAPAFRGLFPAPSRPLSSPKP